MDEEEEVVDFATTCLICSESLDLHKTTEVKEKGMKTFCSASAERNDGFLVLLQNLQSVKVHDRCRLDYINRKNIDKCKKKNKVRSV